MYLSNHSKSSSNFRGIVNLNVPHYADQDSENCICGAQLNLELLLIEVLQKFKATCGEPAPL